MKKIIYLLSFTALFAFTSKAQNAIPNGNFETWNSQSCDDPQNYSDANAQTFFKCNTGCNVVKTTDAHTGSFALKMTTVSNGTDTCMAYIVNSSNPGGGNPCQWTGGFAYTGTPTGISGFYKSNSMPGDSGGVLVAFKNGTTCLGMYMYKLGGVHNTYTPFSFTFNPPIAGTPDTMVFAAVSSDVFNNIQIPGSMLQLDDITFTGAAQPANMNGGFENWTTQTFEVPVSWYMNGGGNGSTGVSKTTDKYAGTYAAQLTTMQGDHNGIPVASPAQISTGYYLNNCGGPNCQKGGFPFTNQIDTLEFYYKYAPSGSDTAQAWIQFKKNGSNVWGKNWWSNSTVSSYTHVKIGFNTGTPIDTVIVQFQSGSWRDTALSFLGSTLKIDDVHFTSQPLNTGIKMYDASVGVKVFPNPSSDGNFTVSNVDRFDLVRVINMYGQEMNAEIVKENGVAKIHMETPGAYIIYINARGKITNLKVIVSKD